MSKEYFDPVEYYKSYPERVILRPGYPARAQFKSTFIWNLFGKYIVDEIGEIKNYADIGGCFGFGANSMAFQISKYQGYYPNTVVFEIASEFIKTGKILFPYIDFVEGGIERWCREPAVFDLVTLFDVIEHIPNPGEFLRILASHSRYILLKTPMETSGEWFSSRPFSKGGADHEDGHVNFFSPGSYIKLLEDSGFQVINSYLVRSIIPHGAETILNPEGTASNHLKLKTKDFQISSLNKLSKPKTAVVETKSLIKKILFFLLPFNISRRIFGGGDHICIVISRESTK